MWAFQHQRRVRVVGVLRIVRRIQYEFGGAIAMEKVIFRTNHESTLGAEHAAAGTTIVRVQSLLVAVAQQHVTDANTRSQQIEQIAIHLVAAADFLVLDLIDGRTEGVVRFACVILGHFVAQANVRVGALFAHDRRQRDLGRQLGGGAVRHEVFGRRLVFCTRNQRDLWIA